MPTITVDVGFDLEDYSTRDLIKELKDRTLSRSDIDKIAELLEYENKTLLETRNLQDKLKAEVILQFFNNKSLEEIQTFFGDLTKPNETKAQTEEAKADRQAPLHLHNEEVLQP